MQYGKVKNDVNLPKLIVGQIGDIISIAVDSGDTYLVSSDHLIKLREYNIVFKRKLSLKGFNMIACTKGIIALANEDSGSILITDDQSDKHVLFKIGEHISDICTFENKIFAITYHDNKLVVLCDGEPEKEIALPYCPQCIIPFNGLCILMNDAFYSYIALYDTDLNHIKTIKLLRQIGIIKIIENKLVFYGDSLRYILNPQLKIISIKKSTGINLCKFDDFLIFEDGEILDINYP